MSRQAALPELRRPHPGSDSKIARPAALKKQNRTNYHPLRTNTIFLAPGIQTSILYVKPTNPNPYAERHISQL